MEISSLHHRAGQGRVHLDQPQHIRSRVHRLRPVDHSLPAQTTIAHPQLKQRPDGLPGRQHHHRRRRQRRRRRRRLRQQISLRNHRDQTSLNHCLSKPTI